MNDGRIAVGIGNFANESSSFYVQIASGQWLFSDVAGPRGIGSPSRIKLSFGLFFFDYDLDGRLDMLQANGHLEESINEIQSSQHYRQATQLFWNAGLDARPMFSAVPEASSGDLARPIVGRGAAYADIDGDGDLDAVLTQPGAAPLLLRNDQTLGHRFIRLRLAGDEACPHAIGAWVEVTAGGVVQRRTVMPTRSYLAQVEPVLTFGLGPEDAIDVVRVRWPDGTTHRIDDPSALVDRTTVIRPQR